MSSLPTPAPVVTGAVSLNKNPLLSKKLWLAAIGLALVLYQQFSGHDATSLADVLDHIQKAAMVLSVIVPTIMVIAHRDAKEIDFVKAILTTAKTIEAPDAPDAAAPAPKFPVQIDPLSGRPIA